MSTVVLYLVALLCFNSVLVFVMVRDRRMRAALSDPMDGFATEPAMSGGAVPAGGVDYPANGPPLEEPAPDAALGDPTPSGGAGVEPAGPEGRDPADLARIESLEVQIGGLVESLEQANLDVARLNQEKEAMGEEYERLYLATMEQGGE